MANKRTNLNEPEREIYSEEQMNRQNIARSKKPSRHTKTYCTGRGKRLKLAEWPRHVKWDRQEEELFYNLPCEVRIAFENFQSSSLCMVHAVCSESQSTSSQYAANPSPDDDMNLDEPTVEAAVEDHTACMILSQSTSKNTEETRLLQHPSTTHPSDGQGSLDHDKTCSGSNDGSVHASSRDMGSPSDEAAGDMQPPQHAPLQLFHDESMSSHCESRIHKYAEHASLSDTKEAEVPTLSEAAHPSKTSDTEEGGSKISCRAAAVENATGGQSLLDLWTVDDAPQEALIHSREESKFVRMLDGDRHVVLIEISKDFMEGMKSATAAKGRLDKLKEMKAKKDRYLVEERAHCCNTCMQMSKEIEDVMDYPPTKGLQRMKRREAQIAEYRKRLQEAEATIQEIDAQVLRGHQLYTQAVDECWNTMWAMSIEHERMLEDAGVSINVDPPCIASEEQCISATNNNAGDQNCSAIPAQKQFSRYGVEAAEHLDERDQGRSTSFANKQSRDLEQPSWFDQESAYRSLNRQPSATADTGIPGTTRQEEIEETAMEQGCRDRVELHERRKADLQYAVDLARYEHDEHRENHDQLFARYATIHPDLQVHELDEKFSAVYLEKWQRLIKGLKDAEDDLVKFQREEKAEAKHQANEEEEREHQEFMDRMNAEVVESFNRDRIERWLAKVPDGFDLSDAMDGSPIVSQQERSINSKTAASHELGPSDHGTGYPQATSEYEPGGLTPHVGRKEQPPDDDTWDDRQQPHVDDVFIDSTSVFDIDPNFRRDIDEMAREYRDGYY